MGHASAGGRPSVNHAAVELQRVVLAAEPSRQRHEAVAFGASLKPHQNGTRCGGLCRTEQDMRCVGLTLLRAAAREEGAGGPPHLRRAGDAETEPLVGNPEARSTARRHRTAPRMPTELAPAR